MTDKTVRVVLTLSSDQYVAALKKAGQDTDAFAKQSESGILKNKDSLNEVAKGFGVVGAAALGFAAVAVKGFADFDQQMSNVAATGDEAANSIDALREAAIKAGADTVFSAGEAANGIEELAKAGMSTADILGGGLRGALDLAAAGGIGVSEAAETMAKTLAQFNLEGSQASHVADLLTAGANEAVGGVHDLGYAMAMGGTVAAQYGLSVEETVGTLAMFAQNALLGSDAGTSLKTMLIKLGNPSKEAANTMADLGIQMYNAYGQFIGMEGVAGQLEKGMAGLTQEQRDQAMATIFGTDAIRAANILYKEGAAGVSRWTAKVDQAGYATRMAAARMDNLKGDLEQLSGSWETAMIRMGSGADAPLRKITQGLTGVVNAMAEMPAGMQAFVLGATAAVGGLSLLAAGGIKAAVAIAEFREAAQKLELAKKAKGLWDLAGGFKGVGAAALVAAAAWAAYAIAEKHDPGRAVTGLEATESALLKVAQASGSAGEELDVFWRRTDGSQMMTTGGDAIKNLQDAFNYLDPKTAGEKINKWSDETAAALNLNRAGVVKVRDEFNELDQTLSKMDTGMAAKAFAKIRAEFDQTGQPLERLLELFPVYKAQLEAQANQLKVTGLTAQDYADWMGGKVPPAIQLAAAAADQADPRIKALADSTQAAADAAAEAEKAARDLQSAYLSLSGSQIAVEAAVDDMTESIAKNGRTLDINTEAGRANMSALNNVASSSRSVRDEMERTGSTVEEVNGVMADNRKRFIEAAEAAGMAKNEAIDLANRYGLIPRDVTTQISAPGADVAKYGTDQFKAALDRLPEAERVAIQALIDSGSIGQAEYALNQAARTRRALIIADYQTGGGGGQSGAGPRAVPAAYGGRVQGYSPHPRADNLLYALTAGEWVIQQPTSRYYGDDIMRALNAGAIRREDLARLLPGRAYGGPVGREMVAGGIPSRGYSSAAPVINVTAPAGKGDIILNSYNPIAEPPSESIRAAASALVLAGSL